MDDAEARALVAATLALMTQFAETRCPLGARKVQENLFRTVLAKLGARWTLTPETPGSLH